MKKINKDMSSKKEKDTNSGSYNSGNSNSGHYNSGDSNSGSSNSGDYNSGDYNSGFFNSGHSNSGDYNSGNRNSGDCNSGHYNSGHCNSGSYNSGSFNTIAKNPTLFNKECSKTEYLDFMRLIPKIEVTKWISAEKSKKQDGHLKIILYKKAWKIAWNSLEQAQKIAITTHPLFNPAVFKKITGINTLDFIAEYYLLLAGKDETIK